MKKIAINGLGRIGRLVLRQYLMDNYQDLEIIAVNDLTPAADIAYLMRYDSVHGKPPFAVESAEDYLRFDSKEIQRKLNFSARKTRQIFPGNRWEWTLYWNAPVFSESERMRLNI